MLLNVIRYKPASEGVQRFIAEIIATFFLIITISMTLQQSATVGSQAPIAIGFMLAAQIFAFGYVSGAVANPAVNVALTLCRLMSLPRLVYYTIAQLTGGLMAALVSWFLVGADSAYKAPNPASDRGLDVLRSVVAEFVFTFALISVILHVACSSQRDNQHYGLAIGMTVIASAYSVGGISGGAFNPAVATSLQLVKCMAGDCHPLRYIWLYWLSPVTAAVAASFIFALFNPIETVHAIEEQQQNENTRASNMREGILRGSNMYADDVRCSLVQ